MGIDARAVISSMLIVVTCIVTFYAMFLSWTLTDILGLLAFFGPMDTAAIAFYFGQKDEAKRIDLEARRINVEDKRIALEEQRLCCSTETMKIAENQGLSSFLTFSLKPKSRSVCEILSKEQMGYFINFGKGERAKTK